MDYTHPANQEPVHFDHLLIYDTETAGLTKEEGVVEHAYVEIDDNFNVLGQMHTLINPPGDVNPSAAGVHGITKDMVKDAPSMDKFMREIHGDRFAGKVVCIIAHNAKFDLKYIEEYCGRAKTLCTLKLARLAFPKDTEGQPEGYTPPPNHKLPTMMFYLGLTKAGTHNALDDVHTCRQLLIACCKKLGITLEEAYHLTNKPMLVKTVPMGKHKGKKVKEVPLDWIEWALANMENMDEDLRYTLEEEKKSRPPLPRRRAY